MNPNKVLICCEKYADLNPDMKLTNSFHNIINTFSRSKPDHIFHLLHHDEANLVYNQHVDNILPNYCKAWGIKSIQFILLGGASCNPSQETYQKLRDQKVHLTFHWPDTGPGWGCDTINQLWNPLDLHISWDNPRSGFHSAFPKRDNHLYLWVPQDPTYFYKDSVQDIPVSFVGSPRYRDRQHCLSHLIKEIPSALVTGGQRESNLSPEKYAELIRRTKIGINFSLSPAMFYQTKGRIFEILASGSMLLELKNPSTSSLFEPGVDYVEFESAKEMVDKIRYYTEHEEERLKIAESGYKKYNEKYTAQKFWDRIIERVELDMTKL